MITAAFRPKLTRASIPRRTADLIAAAGLPVSLDATRGYDHGTSATAYAMYPKADVPMYQVSLLRGFHPAARFALGRVHTRASAIAR